MIDFFGPGFEALSAMGLLPRLRELGHRAAEFRYVDERGRKRAGIDYALFEKAAQGAIVNIMRPDLERLHAGTARSTRGTRPNARVSRPAMLRGPGSGSRRAGCAARVRTGPLRRARRRR
ncbi:hypothetical protein GCM10022205_32030 [Spinactinospora alkalitolerans]